jgi:hypothetical protein
MILCEPDAMWLLAQAVAGRAVQPNPSLQASIAAVWAVYLAACPKGLKDAI